LWRRLEEPVKKPLTAETAETAEKKTSRILRVLCVLCGKTAQNRESLFVFRDLRGRALRA
jgi:hypothetical protein